MIEMEIDEIHTLEFSYYHANLLIKRCRGIGQLYVFDDVVYVVSMLFTLLTYNVVYAVQCISLTYDN